MKKLKKIIFSHFIHTLHTRTYIYEIFENLFKNRNFVQSSKEKETFFFNYQIRQESEIEDSKTIFAEIPWQAMVLHSKERKILCSGVLIGIQEVLTAANCVDR